MLAGALVCASAQGLAGMLAGRLLTGIGIGLSSALVPLYISEVGAHWIAAVGLRTAACAGVLSIFAARTLRMCCLPAWHLCRCARHLRLSSRLSAAAHIDMITSAIIADLAHPPARHPGIHQPAHDLCWHPGCTAGKQGRPLGCGRLKECGPAAPPLCRPACRLQGCAQHGGLHPFLQPMHGLRLLSLPQVNVALPATQWRTMFGLAALPAALLGLGERAPPLHVRQRRAAATVPHRCSDIPCSRPPLTTVLPCSPDVPPHHAAPLACSWASVGCCSPALPAHPAPVDAHTPLDSLASFLLQACWLALNRPPGCSSRAAGAKLPRLEKSCGERRQQPRSWVQVRLGGWVVRAS